MDNVERYRQFIKQILSEHAQISTTTTGEVTAELIFDTEHDHYQLGASQFGENTLFARLSRE